MAIPENYPQRIAVIGGGLAGLAATNRLRELSPSAEVTLLEAGGRLGGVIETVRQDGYLIERGADSFITNIPWALDLCRRIGFADQLIPTDAAHRGASVVAHGKLQPVPEGFLLMAPKQMRSVLASPILSWPGKIRLACEWFVKPRRDLGDESVASFARRRLGREAFERLVQPLVGGIYTADPEKLSLAATLPRFIEMEKRHGGLIRAMRAEKNSSDPVSQDSGARYSLFVTPRDGLSSFIDAIAARLPTQCIWLNTAVERISRENGKWRVSTVSGDTGELFDAVVLATPTAVCARVLSDVDHALADELRAIEYAGTAIVVLAYDRAQIKQPLDSFGFVVPAIERRRILSASFSSVKFPGRAPDGKALIRVFLGGALQPEMLELSDDELRSVAHEELCDLLNVTGEPELSHVFRWPGSMPQYHLGHVERIQRIHDRLKALPGLALAGNAYEGVGIPQTIRSGELAAESVLSNCATH